MCSLSNVNTSVLHQNFISIKIGKQHDCHCRLLVHYCHTVFPFYTILEVILRGSVSVTKYMYNQFNVIITAILAGAYCHTRVLAHPFTYKTIFGGVFCVRVSSIK